jgi:hypothetical protein
MSLENASIMRFTGEKECKTTAVTKHKSEVSDWMNIFVIPPIIFLLEGRCIFDEFFPIMMPAKGAGKIYQVLKFVDCMNLPA